MLETTCGPMTNVCSRIIHGLFGRHFDDTSFMLKLPDSNYGCENDVIERYCKCLMNVQKVMENMKLDWIIPEYCP